MFMLPQQLEISQNVVFLFHIGLQRNCCTFPISPLRELSIFWNHQISNAFILFNSCITAQIQFPYINVVHVYEDIESFPQLTFWFLVFCRILFTCVILLPWNHFLVHPCQTYKWQLNGNHPTRLVYHIWKRKKFQRINATGVV